MKVRGYVYESLQQSSHTASATGRQMSALPVGTAPADIRQEHSNSDGAGSGIFPRNLIVLVERRDKPGNYASGFEPR